MALLDVSKTAQYGLAATWAQQVFSGKMKLGSIQVDYTDSCKSRDTWGSCESGTKQRDQAAKFGTMSTAEGSGLSVNGNEFLATDGNASASWNNMSMIANQASPINMSGVIMQAGNRPNPTTTSGINLYLDRSNFDGSGITFIQNDASASVGQGKVTTSNKQMAAGAGASVEFSFNPQGNPTLSLDYSSSDTVSSKISNGTVNTSSNTQEASLNISNATKVYAGVDIKGVKSGFENTTTIAAGWKGAWTSTNQVNFTKESANSSQTSSKVQVSINLNNLIKNSDGTYGYAGDAPIVVNGESQPGATQQSVTNFVPGQRYRAAIQYNQSNVENTVTGNYNIGGSVGSIVANDTSNKKLGSTVALTAAQAIAAADSFQGAYVFGYGADSVGSLNGSKTEVAFTGSSVFSTSLQTDFSVNYYALTSASSALTSTRSPNAMGLKNKTGAVSEYDLGLVDSRLLEAGNGVWLAMKTLDGDHSIVSGGGTNSNVVQASNEGNHKFVNFTDSMLYGNKNKDIVNLNSSDTGNTMHLQSGNDKVISKGSNNTSILWDGDDSYHLKGGTNHEVELGDGKDKFVIHKAIKNSFHIADFNYIDDVFHLRSGLKPQDFQTRLVNPGDRTNLDGASLEFYYGKTKIGTASLDRYSESYDALTNSKLAQELAFLNAKYYDLDSFQDVMDGEQLPNQAEMFENTVLGQGLLTKDTISSSDWSDMNTNQRAEIVNNAMKSMDGMKTSKKYWKGIIAGQGPAIHDFSLDMVRDSFWWAAIDQAQDTLA